MHIDGRLIKIDRKNKKAYIKQYWTGYMYSAPVDKVRVLNNNPRDVRIYFEDAHAEY